VDTKFRDMIFVKKFKKINKKKISWFFVKFHHFKRISQNFISPRMATWWLGSFDWGYPLGQRRNVFSPVTRLGSWVTQYMYLYCTIMRTGTGTSIHKTQLIVFTVFRLILNLL
jgi:hypothetical protein